jgi:iron complex outermembrane receptor protein
MSSTSQIAVAVRRAVMFGAVAATASLPTLAQTKPEAGTATATEPAIETVVVTGSRIPQPALEANSPLTTVSSEAIAQTGFTRIEDVLNTLPQVQGNMNSGASNGATGTANVSLRGLGPNRTLVLVNGRRLMPGDPTQNGAAAPDLNQIPDNLVERIDVLTGGASAVYGADAVAGVINFVMNDHFQGVRVDGQYSFYNHDNRATWAQAINQEFGYTAPSGNTNDGYQRDFSLIAGSNFADGKGNATTYLTYRRVDPVLQAKRDYSNCSLSSTFHNGTTVLGCAGSSTAYPARFNFQGTDQHLDPATGQLAPGHLLYNFAPLNYFQRPDTRYTGGAFLHYDINDHARLYTEFMFMDDRSTAQIAPAGAFYGAGTAVTAGGVPSGAWSINCNNPYLTTSELGSWCGGVASPATADVLIGRRNVEGGPRIDDLIHTSYRAVAGMKGDINDVWSYDAYGLWGTTEFSDAHYNDSSKQRMGYALNAIQLPSGQIVCQASARVAPGCVPWNIFSLVNGQDGVTPAATAYISSPGIQIGSTTEQVANAAVTGDLGKQGIKLPWAREGLGVSVGAEYRQEQSELHPDQELITNDLAGQGAPTLPTQGSFHVAEVFTEARLPILEDMPFAKSLTAEAGYRYSDYNLSFGSTNTYKFGLQWAPTSDIRFRGMYQRAVRAPNIQELYLQPRVQLDGTADPCAGATPAASLAQCALSGVTAAEYGKIAPNPASQYYGLVGGNTNLAPEKADTYTAGFVFTPRFLPDFSLTVDYYNITIKNFITTYGANLILNTCLASADPFYCNKVHRTQGTGTAADGSLWISTSGYIDDGTFNLGSQRANGIDVGAAYRLDLGRGGDVRFDFNGTYVLKFATEPVNGLGSYDCAGFYGATCGVPNPRWKSKMRGTWTTPVKGLDAYLAWRRINGVSVENLSTNPLLSAAVNTPNLTLGQHLSGVDYIDLGADYSFLEHLSVRVGANNVFDKSPPLSQTSYSTTVLYNGNTHPSVYDALGRYIYVNLTATF